MGDRIVTLPPGCQGLEVGGRTYRGRGAGGGEYAVVPEHHADLINSVDTGGIVSGDFKVGISARNGRRCPVDGKRWFAWTTHCHRCGAETEPE